MKPTDPWRELSARPQHQGTPGTKAGTFHTERCCRCRCPPARGWRLQLFTESPSLCLPHSPSRGTPWGGSVGDAGCTGSPSRGSAAPQLQLPCPSAHWPESGRRQTVLLPHSGSTSRPTCLGINQLLTNSVQKSGFPAHISPRVYTRRGQLVVLAAGPPPNAASGISLESMPHLTAENFKNSESSRNPSSASEFRNFTKPRPRLHF